VCEGLDTIATIYINGMFVGSADNMFRQYEFDIRSVIQTGENNIMIAFTSAEVYSTGKAKEYAYSVPSADSIQVQHGEPFRNFIRKEQCSFSWDWGPCFIPQGIWQPIGILAYSDAVIKYVVPQIFPEPGDTNFAVKVNTIIDAADDSTATVEISVADKYHSQTVNLKKGENSVTSMVRVTNVELWWPRGYGD